MRSSGRKVRVALAAVTLVVTAAPCAAAESFLAANPKVSEAVPYRRSSDARPPQSGDADAIKGSDRDEDGPVETTPRTPSPVPCH